MELGRLLGALGAAGSRPGPAPVQLPARRRSDLFLLPGVVCLLGLLSVVLIAWTGQINDLRRSHLLLIEAILEVQVEAATFHIRLEEHLQRMIDGLPTGNVGEVWVRLDRPRSLMETVLRGGLSEHGLRFGPLEEPGVRAAGETILERLQQLRAIAAKRLENPPAAGVGSALDRQFDAAFQDFQQRGYALEAYAEDAAIRHSENAWRVAAAVHALWALIVGFAAIGVHRHQRARLLAEAELWRARAALEDANLELETRVREKTESLQAANAALTQKVAEVGLIHETLLSHQDRLRELSSQLTLAEERERRRIATELHDRIGTALAFAKMKLASAVTPRPAGSARDDRELTESLALLEQAITDTRSLTGELSAPALYELGLEAALDGLAERTERQHHLRVEVEYDGCAKDLAEDVRVLVFQAVRELLANVVKHAQARNVRIECRREGGDLRVAVVDDGIGFQDRDPQRLQGPDGGFGLFSIRERLGSFGGAVEIESSAAGSRVTLLVPLKADVEQEARPR